MPGATSVKMSIASEVRLVDLVHEASHKMAELAGFDEDEALNVALAVREAVINAILHGNRQDPARSVDLTLRANGKGLTVRIADHGEGFDPERAQDPTSGDARLRTSGRGLLLIRAFVDEVKFKRRKGRGMEITLVKRVRPAAKSPEA
jgi:serine/threonine-protein kinase RsbW